MNTAQEKLVLDLLQKYKKRFLKTPISVDGADELYKWQLITECHEKPDIEIVRHFKTKNIVDTQRVNQVLSDLLKNKQQQLVDCFNGLKDENRSLSERLSVFKKEMGNLCGDKFKSKANDERTAAAFLTCWNPDKYTFFIDRQVYKPYCEYIGEQPRAVGEKYPHYLQLLSELIEIIKQDAELMNKFRNETNGLIQSDLLIAQNILWQMRDMILYDDEIECIIANITWNSNDWKETSSDDSGHRWVQEGGVPHESWNFDFDNKRNTKDKIYGYAKFTNQPKDYQDKKYLVIFRSRNNIIGFYGNTTISDYVGISKNESYNMVGDKSLSLLLENRIDDSSKELLFGKKRVGQNGFNKITRDNAIAILDRAKAMNPTENKIDRIKNWLLQNANNMDSVTNQIKNILSQKKNIILQGAPGTGKTYNTAALALSICGEAIPETHEDAMKRYEELRKEGRIGFCTFHQSMDYEDFVEGIKPKTTNGQITYEVEPGIFKTMCKNAINKDSENFVLIIDEINRGNVSKIFGELITLLEADKRIGGEHPIMVTLPYSKEPFGVPSNLYIIGTMNTTDRSVGNIDYAVRRRFAFVTLESKEEVIEQHYNNEETLKNKALELFNSVKTFLIKHKFDMDIADLMVGHSYFLAKDEEELGLKWKYEIVPLLHEYYKDGITKQDVKADTSIDDFCNSK